LKLDGFEFLKSRMVREDRQIDGEVASDLLPILQPADTHHVPTDTPGQAHY